MLVAAVITALGLGLLITSLSDRDRDARNRAELAARLRREEM